MSFKLKKNKAAGYLLVELLICVVILGSLIMFISRALSSSLFAAKRTTLLNQGVLFAEELFWQAKAQESSGIILSAQELNKTAEVAQSGIKFNLSQTPQESQFIGLSELVLGVSWQQGAHTGKFLASTLIAVK